MCPGKHMRVHTMPGNQTRQSDPGPRRTRKEDAARIQRAKAVRAPAGSGGLGTVSPREGCRQARRVGAELQQQTSGSRQPGQREPTRSAVSLKSLISQLQSQRLLEASGQHWGVSLNSFPGRRPVARAGRKQNVPSAGNNHEFVQRSHSIPLSSQTTCLCLAIQEAVTAHWPPFPWFSREGRLSTHSLGPACPREAGPNWDIPVPQCTHAAPATCRGQGRGPQQKGALSHETQALEADVLDRQVGGTSRRLLRCRDRRLRTAP